MSFTKVTCKNPKNKNLLQKRDLLISGRFRKKGRFLKTTIFTLHLTIACETQTYFRSSFAPSEKPDIHMRFAG